MKTLTTLLWKECKEIRWIWLTMVGAIVLFMRLEEWEKANAWSALWQFLVMGLGIIYCGFVGARAFAGEREKETFHYLHTRPLPPRTILWVKYLLGILQILSVPVVITLSELIFNPALFFENEFYNLPNNPNLWLIFAVLIALYSITFLISVLTGDTVRSFLIGFTVSLLLVLGIGYWNYLKEKLLIPDMHYDMLLIIKDGLDFLTVILLVLGLIGVFYFSLLRKRLVWKTGFWFFFPLAFYLHHHVNYLYYGDMQPIGSTKQVTLLTGTVYGANNTMLHYYQGKFYGYQLLPHAVTFQVQVVAIDIHNPKNPVPKTLLTLPKYSWNPCLDQDHLYVIANTGREDPYAHDQENGQLGYFRTTEQWFSSLAKPGELVVYNLYSGESSREIKRIPLPTLMYDTTAGNLQFPSLPQMALSEHYLYLEYSLITGFAYLDQYHHLTTKQAYDTFTTSGMYSLGRNIYGRNGHTQIPRNGRVYVPPSQRIYIDPIYKTHVLQFDKKTLVMVKQFDLNSTRSNWDEKPDSLQPTYYNPTTKLGYGSNENYALIVYTLLNGGYSKWIKTINWNWLDKLVVNKIGNSSYWRTAVSVSGKRVAVKNGRGENIYDISQPDRPRLVGRLFCEKAEFYTPLQGDYLYTYGPVYGFSIFKLPEVKS